MNRTELLGNIGKLLVSPKNEYRVLGTQLLFTILPPSKFVENYLYDNEGALQSLDNFPMMRQIYDHMPQRMLLKCSRKTLKSTIFSNFITLNMLRWNYYKMMYLGPLEATAKYFSSNYVSARFDSPKIKKLTSGKFEKNDIFEKILATTKSSCLFKYASDDASRLRGPALDHVFADEIAEISYDQIPIALEVLALSKFKRETYAGTPLSYDNTIHTLWRSCNQLEWAMKCGCGHWNTLTEGNNPMKMIRPEGFSCSKCSKVLNTRNGEWVSFNPKEKDFVGYHLAQPLLPHFNEDPKEWKTVYNKITNGMYSPTKVFNEVFGLAYDIASKPISQEELMRVCTLGPMYNDDKKQLKVLKEHRHRYTMYGSGTDWGVSNVTSRTVSVSCALREDGIIEVFFAKIYKSFDYRDHIKEIAGVIKGVDAYFSADSGPSPDRGIELCQLVGSPKGSLVQYTASNFIQRFHAPAGAYDWRQTRWQLHRSDTLTYLIKMIKQGKILFPCWEDMSELMQDILNVFIEVKEGQLRQELRYDHKPSNPDDFIHALNYAVCTLMVAAGDPLLKGASSSASDDVS